MDMMHIAFSWQDVWKEITWLWCAPIGLGLVFAVFTLISIKTVALTRRYEPWRSFRASEPADPAERLSEKRFSGGTFAGNSTLACFFRLSAFGSLMIGAESLTVTTTATQPTLRFAKDDVECVLTEFMGRPAIRFVHSIEGYPRIVALFQNYGFLGKSHRVEEAMGCLLDRGFRGGHAIPGP